MTDRERLLQLLASARSALTAVNRARAEVLTALLFIGGWLLLTAGLARHLGPTTWLFSLGLLALSLGGFKLFGTIVWHGLYLLAADEREAPR